MTLHRLLKILNFHLFPQFQWFRNCGHTAFLRQFHGDKGISGLQKDTVCAILSFGACSRNGGCNGYKRPLLHFVKN